MLIDVTADDIAAGVRRECTRCPIALAATRAFGCSVAVVPGELRIYRDGKHAEIRELPRAARTFMWKFDVLGRVGQPFIFSVPDVD